MGNPVMIDFIRAQPMDASKTLKFIHRLHGELMREMPDIVDRFALPWITDVICFGVCFNACLDGRIIGSIGLAKSHHPFNHYHHHLQSQWFHVMDGYREMARDKLIEKAQTESLLQGFDMHLMIPSYLSNAEDKKGILSGYYFGK
jgi:hypothetical protein